MQWESVQAFFAMGGYALYVWGSFGVTALLMVGEALLLKRRMSGLEQSIKEQA